MPISCPVCQVTSPEPAAQIGAVAICPHCTSSIVIEPAGFRRATAADTVPLSEHDRNTLRKARGRRRT
jgi:hypothetical protein